MNPNIKELKDIFKKVFPELREFPKGHRLIHLFREIEWLILEIEAEQNKAHEEQLEEIIKTLKRDKELTDDIALKVYIENKIQQLRKER